MDPGVTRIILTTLALSCLLLASPTQADTPPCVPGSPGSNDCVHEQPVLIAPQLFERPREKRLRDFFIPNGNLTPAGDFAASSQAGGLYNIFSYGLNKRVELSVSAPVIPAIVGVGGRFALIPPGRKLRAVIGMAFQQNSPKPMRTGSTCRLSAPRKLFQKRPMNKMAMM